MFAVSRDIVIQFIFSWFELSISSILIFIAICILVDYGVWSSKSAYWGWLARPIRFVSNFEFCSMVG